MNATEKKPLLTLTVSRNAAGVLQAICEVDAAGSTADMADVFAAASLQLRNSGRMMADQLNQSEPGCGDRFTLEVLLGELGHIRELEGTEARCMVQEMPDHEPNKPVNKPGE